jgi:hypothetical protein
VSGLCVCGGQEWGWACGWACGWEEVGGRYRVDVRIEEFGCGFYIIRLRVVLSFAGVRKQVCWAMKFIGIGLGYHI